jgi:cyclohexanecarboxylate-CoA ligase
MSTATFQASPVGAGGRTLRDWIEKWAVGTPRSRAISMGSDALEYAGLHERAMSIAGFLAELGVGQGDIVAAQLPNGPEFVLAYLAAGYVGATFQTIHMPYRAAEIEPLLAHSGAKAIFCLAKLKDFSPAEFALSLRSRVQTLRDVIAVGQEAPAGAHPFDNGRDHPSTKILRRPTAADRYLLLYTSGTTSAPKGVPVSYSNFLPNAELSARALEIDDRSILLSAAPLTHLYGLFSLNAAFSAGAATALLPSYSPAALAEAIDIHRPTGLFVAPAHVATCLGQGLLTAERLASLKFILISGSACPPELARTVQDLMLNGEVHQLWGMSELQAGSFTRPGDDPHVRFTTVGRASPGTSARVVLDDEPASHGIEGELQVSGPSVFAGYRDNASATAGAFTDDGWFCTGDLARMDTDGNIQITGRSKDVINRGGVKFNPADVEALIARHCKLRDCSRAGSRFGGTRMLFRGARGGGCPDESGGPVRLARRPQRCQAPMARAA